jgi:phosphatidylglycerol---prolipoprotein diacylglyceryl transferase
MNTQLSSPYGLCLALGLLVGGCASTGCARLRGISAGLGIRLGLLVFLVTLTTQRTLGECFGGSASDFRAGGFVPSLGIAFVAFLGISKILDLNWLEFVDVAAPGLGLWLGVAKIGCFLTGCCHGTPSESFLAVTYSPNQSSRTGAPAFLPLHPVQLYESAGYFALGLWLFFAFRRNVRTGATTAWFLIGYGAVRFCLEFLRSGAAFTHGLHLHHFLCPGLVVLGALLLKRAGPEPACPEPIEKLAGVPRFISLTVPVTRFGIFEEPTARQGVGTKTAQPIQITARPFEKELSKR